MENRQKWVNLTYILGAGMVAYVVFELGFSLAGQWDLEARVNNIDLIIRGASVVMGALMFLFLYRSDRINQYMNEVVVELSRVTWPTAKDTYKATIVVIIMVLISGMFLGGMDALWTRLIQWIL